MIKFDKRENCYVLMEMFFLAYMNENLLLSIFFLDLLINPEKNVWNLKSEIMYLIYDIERNYVILYLSHFINLVNE